MTMDYGKGLSERIGTLRKESKLTQEQLAKRLGVTSQAVSKWENEQSCPDVSLLPQLADIFRVSIDELFGRNLNPIDLRAGLVAEYLFNGNARDSSGYGRHGTVIGAALCEDRFGRPERAYYFDGNNDYLIMDPPPEIHQDQFTLSVWCYYEHTQSRHGWHSSIVSQDGHLRNRVFQLSTRDDRMVFHRFLLQPDMTVQASLQKNYWYHICVYL